MKKKSLSVKKKVHKLLLSHLKNKKILKVFREFNTIVKDNNVNKLAVAVSGGPDSLALAYIAKCFSLLNNVNVQFFIVNHKIRKNSSAEAKKIKLFLKNFDISSHILNWQSKKPKSNIQSIARKNRYNLLLKACKKNHISYLLLGHHLDDLYENFFIRLLRGSGLKGLISFAENVVYEKDNILIIRPFLKFEKYELIYVSRKVFQFFIDDPSNKKLIYQRNRIRNLISNFKKEGFDSHKLNLTIKNLKVSNDTINFYVQKNILDNSRFNKEKNLYIINNKFFNQSEEVMFRSFSSVLKIVSKKYYSPRGKSISEAILKIQSNKMLKITLGGCFIEKINQTILITKEF